MFSNLWTYLRSITVNCLTASEDQVIFHVLQSTCNCGRCCPCICTTKYTVSDQNTIISTVMMRYGASCHSQETCFAGK